MSNQLIYATYFLYNNNILIKLIALTLLEAIFAIKVM